MAEYQAPSPELAAFVHQRNVESGEQRKRFADASSDDAWPIAIDTPSRSPHVCRQYSYLSELVTPASPISCFRFLTSLTSLFGAPLFALSIPIIRVFVTVFDSLHKAMATSILRPQHSAYWHI